EDGLHRPALVVRQRTALDDPDAVADLALVLLVVRLVADALGQVLAVLSVPDEPRDDHHDRLVHLIRDDHSLALLAPPGFHDALRCLSTVLTRARLRLVSRTFIGLGSCELARRSRRWKSSSVSSRSRVRSSSSVMSRASCGFMVMPPADAA